MMKKTTHATKKVAASDWREKTMSRICELVKKTDPNIVEEVKYKTATNPDGVFVWYSDGMLGTGETYKEHLRIGLTKGHSLKEQGDDPKGLINTYRAIVLREEDKLNEAAFKKLIRAAVKLNAEQKKKPAAKPKKKN